ncbi:hypothetical protein LUZ62_039320 [Rhynchospora pubera]|uniref:Uncharacterized protein n=1 Tax=Rhynchospora pubera TaxID=906938 RepID=A0AAV8F4N8_9POAL|nr:hypothetical protein LUZ62_039320 [Rhynchospora pubera]
MKPETDSSPPKLPPRTTNSASSRSNSSDKKNRNKKQLPSPEEILSHYESQGLDTRAASLQAISHLQALLFKTVASNSASSVRKVDTINTRLAIIEAKLDSKPGFVQSFAIGVVSGAALNGFGSAFPYVLHGLSNAWNSARMAMANSSSNPSS